MKRYGDSLTADINRKGVLDVDVVKGCTSGMRANPGTGCYDACYAASIAKFRGFDFSTAVVRRVKSKRDAIEIERAVKASPHGFFRIGTMGDPSHAWTETVEVCEWLAPLSMPVIVTKHWQVASDAQLARLVACGAVLNTSISALDTPAQLAHRERQISRYAAAGGHSVARVVTCEFDTSTGEGQYLADVQDRLLSFPLVIDNPLRIPRTHPLAFGGLVKLKSVTDLTAKRTVSLASDETYIGHCNACPDKCGLSTVTAAHVRAKSIQRELFQ